MNLAFRMHLRDSKSGFILCRRDVLANLLRHRLNYRYFQSFIGVAAGLGRCMIVEVDTTFERRHAGQSFLGRFPVRVCLRICWELLKFRAETWAAAYTRARSPRAWAVPPIPTTLTGEV